jgi:Flp pilus assembly protein TadD
MSRFVNREFGDESEDRLRSEEQSLVKDEAYYLAQAQSGFENADFERALRAYSKVLEYNPANTTAWTGQVRMLTELGEFREARLWADKALERFPHEPDLLAAKAVALARSGDLQGGQAFSDASIEERGGTPYVWLARGDVLLARSEARADFCFEKARLLAPRDWFILWLAARIRLYYRQFVLALKLLKEAIELNPGHFYLWLEQGRCLGSLGMVNAAAHSFDQARQLNPQSPEAREALARASKAGLLARCLGWLRERFRP